MRKAFILAMILFGALDAHAVEFKTYGQNFWKRPGTPRSMVVFLFDGMTAQDFVGIYSMMNFVGGPDLKITFAAKKKGLVYDDRGRLGIYADKAISDVKHADLFIVPGGRHFSIVKDKRVLKWVKEMYDGSEYTASICTGSAILGAAGAIDGKDAGIAWAGRDLLKLYGVRYVPTPPPSVDGKYFSAAGAAAGIEIALMLIERITGSPQLSELAEFGAEWNPHMMYGAGDPEKAPAQVRRNFESWMQSDPYFKP